MNIEATLAEFEEKFNQYPIELPSEEIREWLRASLLQMKKEVLEEVERLLELEHGKAVKLVDAADTNDMREYHIGRRNFARSFRSQIHFSLNEQPEECTCDPIMSSGEHLHHATCSLRGYQQPEGDLPVKNV